MAHHRRSARPGCSELHSVIPHLTQTRRSRKPFSFRTTTMQMYNSSPERINPPRRKSCDACWMAKRRCDFALPACLRCARRNLPCVYPGQQPAISQEPSSDISLLMEQVDGLSSSIYVGPQGTGNASSGAPTFSTMDPVLDGSDTELVHLISPVFHPAVRDQNNCMAILRTRSSRPVSTIIATRLQFAIDRIKEAPRTTVLENQTPWSHSQLYKDGMPRAMQGKEPRLFSTGCPFPGSHM